MNELSPNKELEELNEAYCKASNELWEYRRKHGFNPGARVLVKDKDYFEGVIPSFGTAWSFTNRMCVPVEIQDGKIQNWMMTDLQIIELAPEDE